MRFYFHLHNDIESIDPEGMELPDAGAARQHAEKVARLMAAESVREGHLNLSHYIETSDDADKLLFKVTFGDAVDVTR